MECTLNSNLILPSNYYELDREEMSYVEGGEGYTTYTGLEALNQIGILFGAGVSMYAVTGSLVALFTKGAITAETGVGAIVAILAGLGMIASLSAGGLNIAAGIAALSCYMRDGGFRVKTIGFWTFSVSIVKSL